MKVHTRDIWIKDYKELPIEKMKGTIEIPYYGKLVLGYDELPETFDYDLDWEIICDCDLEEIKGFKHVDI